MHTTQWSRRVDKYPQVVHSAKMVAVAIQERGLCLRLGQSIIVGIALHMLHDVGHFAPGHRHRAKKKDCPERDSYPRPSDRSRTSQPLNADRVLGTEVLRLDRVNSKHCNHTDNCKLTFRPWPSSELLAICREKRSRWQGMLVSLLGLGILNYLIFNFWAHACIQKMPPSKRDSSSTSKT